MAKLPYMQFYPGDWLLDTHVLSPATRGIWIDILCLMWREEPRTGTMEYTASGWCKRLRCSDAEFRTAVVEMEAENVCKILKDECKDSVRFTSRRMSREEKLRKSNRLYVSKYRSKTACKDSVSDLKDDCKGENQNQNQSHISESESELREEKNKKKKEKTPLPPKGGVVMVDDFHLFWNAYPRKVGKEAARRVWVKLGSRRPPLDILLKAIESQKDSEQWQKDEGQFIPHPATWLNQGRWDDVVSARRPSLMEEFLARGKSNANGSRAILQRLADAHFAAVGKDLSGSRERDHGTEDDGANPTRAVL